jgi:hypothetical protein
VLSTKLNLELVFENNHVGFSARRIWEHIEYRQVNPFSIQPSLIVSDAMHFIDIVRFEGSKSDMILSEATLRDLFENNNLNLFERWTALLKRQILSPAGKKWLGAIQNHIDEHLKQVFVRNKPDPFLKTGKAFTLGITGLNCALLTWLDQNRENKARPEQWFNRIKNLESKGLKLDEYKFSLANKQLEMSQKNVISGADVKSLLDYSQLQISILPVLKQSQRHLNFRTVPANHRVKRIKPKIKTIIGTLPEWYDAVLGYWVDRITWEDLFGVKKGWMAFTHLGQPVIDKDHISGLCSNAREAMGLANEHARDLYPMINTIGHWSEYSLTGGKDYREWLVTLPYFRESYFSDHFNLRNILFHIRSDLREGPDNEPILFIQEIQSDWAQQARKYGRNKTLTPKPPWLNEWAQLALKLLLLHASKSRVAALAWTTGDIQVARWNGLGKNGLLELYDKTLPSALGKILKSYKRGCDTIEVFLPTNYFIEPSEQGYEVRDKDRKLLGIAETWQKARELIPCGSHEKLIPVHGIKLDAGLKERVLEEGFFAWGSGIA